MIAIGKPFVEILMDVQLTLEEYFVLYCFSYDKRDLIKLYSKNIETVRVSTLKALKDKGYLFDVPKWVITEKGNSFIRDLVDSYHDAKADNPFLGDEDLIDLAENVYEKEFDLFLSAYPTKSIRIDGRVDYLKEGTKEIKKLYLSLIQSGRSSTHDLQKAVEFYAKRQEAKGLSYIKTLKNWLKQDIWRDTLNVMTTEKEINKEDINYGGKFI
tara:strand:- start:9113 stop:9751 length:639 start_codon:yes stop_codon:yes gene_type:complete